MDASHTFDSGSVDWGFKAFHTVQDILDPQLGFMDEAGTITIWCQLRVEDKELPSSSIHPEQQPLVGLYNQGATCYLNSLLQALFHTQEFRRIVYSVPTEGKQPGSDVTYALQRLFYALQCQGGVADTRELTQAFGWGQTDAFMQHDVQEMSRVLCDNLEERTKSTVAEGSISRLFSGCMRNFIRCVNVDYCSSRDEEFYDLQLDVKGCKDVYESFAKYVEVERLEGDNQYAADKHGKQDAEKGVSFVSLPPILHLHLKRFEYDPYQDAMVKVNDRYEFPTVLDLREFLQAPTPPKAGEEGAADGAENGSEDAPEGEEEAESKEGEKKKKAKPEPTRPEDAVYVLQSVLVHSGDVGAGHYFAFVRQSLAEMVQRDAQLQPNAAAAAVEAAAEAAAASASCKPGEPTENRGSSSGVACSSGVDSGGASSTRPPAAAPAAPASAVDIDAVVSDLESDEEMEWYRLDDDRVSWVAPRLAMNGNFGGVDPLGEKLKFRTPRAGLPGELEGKDGGEAEVSAGLPRVNGASVPLPGAVADPNTAAEATLAVAAATPSLLPAELGGEAEATQRRSFRRLRRRRKLRARRLARASQATATAGTEAVGGEDNDAATAPAALPTAADLVVGRVRLISSGAHTAPAGLRRSQILKRKALAAQAGVSAEPELRPPAALQPLQPYHHHRRACSTSAYMLVYVRLSQLRSLMAPVPRAAVPAHLVRALAQERLDRARFMEERRLAALRTEVLLLTSKHLAQFCEYMASADLVWPADCIRHTTLKTTTFRQLGQRLADRLAIPFARQRLWVVGRREHNKTALRVYAAVTGRLLDRPLHALRFDMLFVEDRAWESLPALPEFRLQTPAPAPALTASAAAAPAATAHMLPPPPAPLLGQPEIVAAAAAAASAAALKGGGENKRKRVPSPLNVAAADSLDPSVAQTAAAVIAAINATSARAVEADDAALAAAAAATAATVGRKRVRELEQGGGGDGDGDGSSGDDDGDGGSEQPLETEPVRSRRRLETAAADALADKGSAQPLSADAGDGGDGSSTDTDPMSPPASGGGGGGGGGGAAAGDSDEGGLGLGALAGGFLPEDDEEEDSDYHEGGGGGSSSDGISDDGGGDDGGSDGSAGSEAGEVTTPTIHPSSDPDPSMSPPTRRDNSQQPQLLQPQPQPQQQQDSSLGSLSTSTSTSDSEQTQPAEFVPPAQSRRRRRLSLRPTSRQPLSDRAQPQQPHPQHLSQQQQQQQQQSQPGSEDSDASVDVEDPSRRVPPTHTLLFIKFFDPLLMLEPADPFLCHTPAATTADATAAPLPPTPSEVQAEQAAALVASYGGQPALAQFLQPPPVHRMLRYLGCALFPHAATVAELLPAVRAMLLRTYGRRYAGAGATRPCDWQAFDLDSCINVVRLTMDRTLEQQGLTANGDILCFARAAVQPLYLPLSAAAAAASDAAAAAASASAAVAAPPSSAAATTASIADAASCGGFDDVAADAAAVGLHDAAITRPPSPPLGIPTDQLAVPATAPRSPPLPPPPPATAAYLHGSAEAEAEEPISRRRVPPPLLHPNLRPQPAGVQLRPPPRSHLLASQLPHSAVPAVAAAEEDTRSLSPPPLRRRRRLEPNHHVAMPLAPLSDDGLGLEELSPEHPPAAISSVKLLLEYLTSRIRVWFCPLPGSDTAAAAAATGGVGGAAAAVEGAEMPAPAVAMELQLRLSYRALTALLSRYLQLPDPNLLRLTLYHPVARGPQPTPLRYSKYVDKPILGLFRVDMNNEQPQAETTEATTETATATAQPGAEGASPNGSGGSDGSDGEEGGEGKESNDGTPAAAAAPAPAAAATVVTRPFKVSIPHTVVYYEVLQEPIEVLENRLRLCAMLRPPGQLDAVPVMLPLQRSDAVTHLNAALRERLLPAYGMEQYCESQFQLPPPPPPVPLPQPPLTAEAAAHAALVRELPPLVPNKLPLRVVEVQGHRAFQYISQRSGVNALPRPFQVELQRVAKPAAAPAAAAPETQANGDVNAEAGSEVAAAAGEAGVVGDGTEAEAGSGSSSSSGSGGSSEPEVVHHSALYVEVIPLDDYCRIYWRNPSGKRLPVQGSRNIQVLHFTLPTNVATQVAAGFTLPLPPSLPPSPSALAAGASPPGGVQAAQATVVDYEVVHASPRLFGTPLVATLGREDTVSLVRERLRLRLGVAADEFASWRLALLVHGYDFSKWTGGARYPNDRQQEHWGRWAVVYLDSRPDLVVVRHPVLQASTRSVWGQQSGSASAYDVLGAFATTLALERPNDSAVKVVRVQSRSYRTYQPGGITIRK